MTPFCFLLEKKDYFVAPTFRGIHCKKHFHQNDKMNIVMSQCNFHYLRNHVQGHNAHTEKTKIALQGISFSDKCQC